jgi:Adenylate and Guanylate cyclase catalytic domain
VIGRKRFLYDLWGDAVNTASRMESHGTPGRIQITRATYELLADEFECEPRGTIAVKGKGEVEAWYLIRPRDDGPSAANDKAHEPTFPDRGHAETLRNTGPRSTWDRSRTSGASSPRSR